MMNMASIILMVLASLLPFLPLPVPVFYFWWRNRRWAPRNVGRSVGVRRFETLLTVVVIALISIVWLYDGTPRIDTPNRFSEGVSETIRNYNMWGAAFGSCIALVVVAIAWRFNTTLAVMSLLITGLFGVAAVDSKIRQQQDVEREAKWQQSTHATPTETATPVKLRFELIDNIAGADLWMNGVLLGKTPYETTSSELMAKVPRWEHQDVNPLKNPGSDENSFVTPQGNSVSSWGWCPLHFPVSNPDSTKLYYKVELNVVTGFSRLIQQKTEGVHGSSDSVIVVIFDTVFPAWERDIEDLLDRARLDDYRVDKAWLSAFDSYGDFATRQLETAIVAEPELKRIQETRARFAANLSEVTDAATAWTHLMRIEEEARTSHQYDSGSASGIAVDLLVPLLDPEQLVEHAVTLLNRTPKPDPGSRSGGGERFATYSEGGSVHGDETALWPIAQAIWRLDQRLDAGLASDNAATAYDPNLVARRGLYAAIHPETDNLVERRITPLILKLSYGNAHRLEYAAVLGGSVYEEFLLRNDWRRPATNSYGEDLSVGDHDNYVNGWFYKLLWLRSPLGTAFRDQRSDEIVKLCRNGLSDFSLATGTLPSAFDFLFLDREYSKGHPSLAMKFWPEVDGRAKAAKKHELQEMLKMRWDYLARLWPESTSEMFLSAFREAMDPDEYMYIPVILPVVPADGQYEILQMILTAEVDRIALLPSDPPNESGPKYYGERIVDDLRSRLLWLPCEPAAQRLVEDALADPKHAIWGSLPGLLAYDTFHEDLIRLIVDQGNTKMKLLALPAIERHPIPRRQELLERLLTAEDTKVRESAEAVKQRLNELGRREFAHRENLVK